MWLRYDWHSKFKTNDSCGEAQQSKSYILLEKFTKFTYFINASIMYVLTIKKKERENKREEKRRRRRRWELLTLYILYQETIPYRIFHLRPISHSSFIRLNCTHNFVLAIKENGEISPQDWGWSWIKERAMDTRRGWEVERLYRKTRARELAVTSEESRSQPMREELQTPMDELSPPRHQAWELLSPRNSNHHRSSFDSWKQVSGWFPWLKSHLRIHRLIYLCITITF